MGGMRNIMLIDDLLIYDYTISTLDSADAQIRCKITKNISF